MLEEEFLVDLKKMFLKEVSWGHQSCVGFITITIKTAILQIWFLFQITFSCLRIF